MKEKENAGSTTAMTSSSTTSSGASVLKQKYAALMESRNKVRQVHADAFECARGRDRCLLAHVARSLARHSRRRTRDARITHALTRLSSPRARAVQGRGGRREEERPSLGEESRLVRGRVGVPHESGLARGGTRRVERTIRGSERCVARRKGSQIEERRSRRARRQARKRRGGTRQLARCGENDFFRIGGRHGRHRGVWSLCGDVTSKSCVNSALFSRQCAISRARSPGRLASLLEP